MPMSGCRRCDAALRLDQPVPEPNSLVHGFDSTPPDALAASPHLAEVAGQLRRVFGARPPLVECRVVPRMKLQFLTDPHKNASDVGNWQYWGDAYSYPVQQASDV